MKHISVPAKIRLSISYCLFGTIGIFVRWIGLPSSIIALSRAVIGTLFLLAIDIVRGNTINLRQIRHRIPLLLLSGTLLGFNWILYFEAIRFTTIATATLCYYCAPIFVIIMSVFILKDRMTLRKAGCIAVVLAGMVLVSGVLDAGGGDANSYQGVLFGLSAAVLYASATIINIRLQDVSTFDRTTLQLGAAALVILPYVFLNGAFLMAVFKVTSVALLVVVGIVHTGFAYMLYFGAMPELKPQTIALYSYIDPILSILLSALLLREPMSLRNVIGAAMILGATYVSERLE